MSPTIRAIHDEVLRQRGGLRADDVDFTFTKGKWEHLGEATLFNRVKSHPDVGERWYPELLARARAEQIAVEKDANDDTKQESNIAHLTSGQSLAIPAH